MEFIWQTLAHTPWWVYILFFYLIYVGIRASKTRAVPLTKLFIIPLIFLFMSVHTLTTSFGINAVSVSWWSGAIILGAVLGWLQVFYKQLRIDREHKLIKVPGAWGTLILILIIFGTKYYFGYELAVDPQLVQQTHFEISMLVVSGICTGLFIGRLICYLYRFKTLASVDLAP